MKKKMFLCVSMTSLFCEFYLDNIKVQLQITPIEITYHKDYMLRAMRKKLDKNSLENGLKWQKHW